jgi:hypothetical protein
LIQLGISGFLLNILGYLSISVEHRSQVGKVSSSFSFAMKYPSLFGQALLIVGMFTVKSQQVITARGRVRDGVPPAQIWPPAGDRGDRFGNSQTARGQNASDTPGHYTITPNQLNNSALVDSFQNDLFKVVSENTVYASQCPGLGVLFWFANLTSSQAEQLKGKCHNVILPQFCFPSRSFLCSSNPVQLIDRGFPCRLHSRQESLFRSGI